MPAVTPTEPTSLPAVAEAEGMPRPVEQVGNAVQTFEGGGFPVRRPFPGALDQTRTDPFLMLDQMGPIVYAPGEALGAPDHPHRGFETVTYLIDGEVEHRDSYGGGGVIRGGDTQWMTAGAGLVHSEEPTEKMMREGGLSHGVQIWVNLPRSDKRAEPRYQDITGDKLTLFRNDDGSAIVRLIAGDLAGQHGPGSTHTPIVLAHATLQPGAHLALGWPKDFNALVYVLSGAGRVGGAGGRALSSGQVASLGAGDTVVLDVHGDSTEPLEVLLLGGQPIREPIVSYGPFVMNTKSEIIEAMDDFQAGKMGSIPPRVAS
jgi:redox-sensitive bicupin YhaK (pirin superfamily)